MMLKERWKMALIPDVDRRRMEANRENKSTGARDLFTILAE